MKFLLILSTVIVLADSICPKCYCGDVRELLQPEVEIQSGGSGCYLNLSCPDGGSYTTSSDKTSNLPIPEGYEIGSFAAYTGDNLMDAFGIVCENKTWYITKFNGYMNYNKIGELGNFQMNTYEWEGKGYRAVLGGFECPYIEFVLKSAF